MKIIDDFLPDLPLVKKFIEGTEYVNHDLLGKIYTGFGRVSLPVKALIEEEMGPVSIRVCYLRKGAKDTPLTHYIHADRAVAKYAFVLCLSEPDCSSGTAFWTHKETGLSALPVPTPPDLFQLLDADLTDETKWRQTGFVESKENRAVIFDAAMFHSRWPKVIESETPRIVCTAFFDVNAELEVLAEHGGNTDLPPILAHHRKIRKVPAKSNGILPWPECKDLPDVLECNAVNMRNMSIYLDHDHKTAAVFGNRSKFHLEACKFITSMGYQPLEISHG